MLHVVFCQMRLWQLNTSTGKSMLNIHILGTKNNQNMHLYAVLSYLLLYNLTFMPNVPWVCSFSIFIALCRRWKKRQNHMFVDVLGPRWERETIFLCFMYFLWPKMWFSSCYCLVEVHMPYRANTSILFSLRWPADSDRSQVPSLTENYSDHCLISDCA